HRHERELRPEGGKGATQKEGPQHPRQRHRDATGDIAARQRQPVGQRRPPPPGRLPPPRRGDRDSFAPVGTRSHPRIWSAGLPFPKSAKSEVLISARRRHTSWPDIETDPQSASPGPPGTDCLELRTATRGRSAMVAPATISVSYRVSSSPVAAAAPAAWSFLSTAPAMVISRASE